MAAMAEVQVDESGEAPLLAADASERSALSDHAMNSSNSGNKSGAHHEESGGEDAEGPITSSVDQKGAENEEHSNSEYFEADCSLERRSLKMIGQAQKTISHAKLVLSETDRVKDQYQQVVQRSMSLEEDDEERTTRSTQIPTASEDESPTTTNVNGVSIVSQSDAEEDQEDPDPDDPTHNYQVDSEILSIGESFHTANEHDSDASRQIPAIIDEHDEETKQLDKQSSTYLSATSDEIETHAAINDDNNAKRGALHEAGKSTGDNVGAMISKPPAINNNPGSEQVEQEIMASSSTSEAETSVSPKVDNTESPSKLETNHVQNPLEKQASLPKPRPMVKRIVSVDSLAVERQQASKAAITSDAQPTPANELGTVSAAVTTVAPLSPDDSECFTLQELAENDVDEDDNRSMNLDRAAEEPQQSAAPKPSPRSSIKSLDQSESHASVFEGDMSFVGPLPPSSRRKYSFPGQQPTSLLDRDSFVSDLPEKASSHRDLNRDTSVRSQGDESLDKSVQSMPFTDKSSTKQRRSSLLRKMSFEKTSSNQSVSNSSSIGSHSPMGGSQRVPVGRSNSFKVGKVWKGIKKRINVIASVNKLKQDDNEEQKSSFRRNRNNSPKSAKAAYRRAHTSPVRTTKGRFAPGNADILDRPLLEGIESKKPTNERVPRGRAGRNRSPLSRSRSKSEDPGIKLPPRRTNSHHQQPSIPKDRIAELEVIAQALRAGLKFVPYQDRFKKSYKNCFTGSAAVDFLCHHTRKSRAEALEVGRLIAHHFGLFVTVGGARPMSTTGTLSAASSQSYSFVLQDSSTAYYRIIAFLPSEVQRMNSETKMEKFEDGVNVKTRRQGLRKHKKCFVGADAVTYLVQSRLVRSRGEAVELGNRFIAEFNLFEPINRDSDFMDSRNKLYRFVDKRFRYFSINNYLSTRMITMGRYDTDTGDASNEDPAMMNSERLGESGIERSDTEDESDDYSSEKMKAYQQLMEVADVLERGIKVSDNTKRVGSSKKISYKDTFAAARAVTFMVTSGLADNRQEAEKLGRRLEREFNLFSEVSGKHDFSDSNHFFRFTEKKERFTQPVKGGKPLSEIAELFEQGVKVKDYTYRLTSYKNTFTGSRAVDFLVNSRLASSRVHAVRIGCQLVEDFNLFENISGNRDFCDDQHFYRFTPVEKRRKPDRVKRRRSGRAMLLDRSTPSRKRLVPTHASEELLELGEAFLDGVKVKEHKFRAKPYRQTFVGSEAVSFMVNSSLARSRKEAVDLGKRLSKELHLFVQIDGTKDFKDDYLLYRFAPRFDEQFRGSTAIAESHSMKSLPLEEIAERFRGGIKLSDNREKKEIFKGSFIGTDAVDFLVGSGMVESRVEAVDLGRSLAREFNLFEHVRKQCEFEDEDIVYRFCYEGKIKPLEEIQMDVSRLMAIAKDLETCIKTREHKVHLRKYKATFLGSEAVDYLVGSCTASTRKEAVQIGRAITKEFNLFEHVTNDRKFEDAAIPYFFVKDEQRYKGLSLEKKRARRNIFDLSDDDDSISNVDEMRSSHDSQHSGQDLLQFSFATEDKEWANKMATFERRMQKMHSSKVQSVDIASDDSSVSTTEAKKLTMQSRFYEWASKFRRLDPRYQIEYFFDFVAQDGAEQVEANVMEVDNLRPLFNFLPNRSQVFTVWRPTSADAIKKMMLGEAVGKGLDIKGKSAKRGKLSGFVPFLQIGENKHKSRIRPPSKEGVVRVFYPGEARRGRDIAAEKLERVGLEMIQTVEAAKKVLADNEASKAAQDDALEAMLLDMGPDPSVLYIDDYAPHRYGLEIPERLFWEAYFVRQDCTRKPGSEYDTGRPSQPAFQDMNFAAIRAGPKDGAPRAVVYQSADPDSPMNPFELLVAYEENNRVMPVVSDFDCFLVGTKRVQFKSPLAPDQMNVLEWYVNEIESVMKNSAVGDSWTVNWLEVLKKAAREGFYPEMPQFGFGDPKSYSIMKNAVSRLSHSGAVRHGAECFNYYFPQDLDDEFLVIANDLPDNKPWAYVDVEGLQDILSQKIDEGFTFPLNPKWVLADSFRWKELYDKLLLSDKAETKQSMNIWFPPESGLRDQIERIHSLRPNGFYREGADAERDEDDSSETGDAAARARDAKENIMSTVFALRLLEKFQQKTKKYQSSGTESNEDVSESETSHSKN